MDYKVELRDLTKPTDLTKLASSLSELADELDTLYTETAPNGNISARRGRIALYNNAGTYTVWQNTDGGTTWQQTDHIRLHDIDSTSDHNGVSGATEDNLASLDANGLPKDSGYSASDLQLSAKVGYFTRDTALASGTQEVTGVGFQPRAVIFIATQSGTAGETSWGFDDGSTPYVLADYGAIAAGQHYMLSAKSIRLWQAANDSYDGKVNSFDSDGFTIGWTKNNNPSGTAEVIYIALR